MRGFNLKRVFVQVTNGPDTKAEHHRALVPSEDEECDKNGKEKVHTHTMKFPQLSPGARLHPEQ